MRRSSLYLSIALAVAVGYAAYLQVENDRLRERASGAEFTKRVASMSAAAPVAVAREAVESALPSVSSSASAATEVGAASQPAPATGRSEDWQDRRRDRAQRFLRAFDDPELRLDMVERQMERVDASFSDFFRNTDLSEEQIDTIKTLLAEREVTRWEERMKGFSLVDDAARSELSAEMDSKRVALTAEIAAVLGEDLMSDFGQYEKGLPYRRDVEQFASSLSYTRTPMTADQSEMLVARLAEADQGFEYTKDLSNMRRNGNGSGDLTPADVDLYFQERATRDDLLVANARSVLSEAQLRAFAERQIAERERDRREMEFRLQGRQTGD